MNERIAVYAGSFDPPTNGHCKLIALGAKLFDRLIVAVGVNSTKTPWFTVEERMELLNESAIQFARKNVTLAVLPANTYAVAYASQMRAQYLLRGLRSGTDFEAEHDMQELNGYIATRLPVDDVQTVYLSLDMHSRVLSSSNVKALVGPDHWEAVVAGLVPPPVLEALKRRASAPDA